MTPLFPTQGHAQPRGRVRGQFNAGNSKAETTQIRCVAKQHALRRELSLSCSMTCRVIVGRGPAMLGDILCEVTR